MKITIEISSSELNEVMGHLQPHDSTCVTLKQPEITPELLQRWLEVRQQEKH